VMRCQLSEFSEYSYERNCYTSGCVGVVSSSKLHDDVASPTVSHRLEPEDSQGDVAVPRSVSSSESAARPQPPGHDELYEQSHPERPYYDAVQPRPPLPSQPPSGTPSH